MTGQARSAFTRETLERDLPTRRVGRTCMVYERVESTNDTVRAVAGDRRYDGLAVFAEHQTNGRGRNGRRWQAASGSSVLGSVLVIFEGDAASLSGSVNLAGAVAAAGAVRRCFDISATIKWPNDVYVGDKKLGGILIESAPFGTGSSAFVIGVGLNVMQTAGAFPEDIAARACSVATVLGRPVDSSARLRLARQLLIELDRTVAMVVAGAGEQLRAEWLALAGDRDRPVTVEHDGKRFQGRIIDVAPQDHSLLIQDQTGLIWHLEPNRSRLIR